MDFLTSAAPMPNHTTKTTTRCIVAPSHTGGSGKVRQYASQVNDTIEQMEKNLKSASKTYSISSNVSNAASAASALVAGLDAACSFLGLPNPVDELIRKPFFGDWDELGDSSAAWSAMSTDLHAVSEALTESAASVQDGAWEGEAASAYASCCRTFAGLFDSGAAPCSEVSQALDGLADLAQKALDIILDAIGTFAALAMDIEELIASGALALTGVGAIVTVIKGIDVANTVRQAADVITRAIEAIKDVYDAITAFAGCIVTMYALANQVKGIRMIAAS